MEGARFLLRADFDLFLLVLGIVRSGGIEFQECDQYELLSSREQMALRETYKKVKKNLKALVQKPVPPRKLRVKSPKNKLPRPVAIGTNIQRKSAFSCDCSGCLEFNTRYLNAVINNELWTEGRAMYCERLILPRQANPTEPRENVSKDPFSPTPIHRTLPAAKYCDEVFIKNVDTSKESIQMNLERMKNAAKKGSADWVAEVVVLAAMENNEYPHHQSLRAIHVLRCLGVEFFCINGEANFSDINSPEAIYTGILYKLGRTVTDIAKRRFNSAFPIRLPQIFVDGQLIGDYSDLMDLVDDNDLPYILARDRCPTCLYPRTGSGCLMCGAEYKYTISSEIFMDAHRSLVNMNLNQSGNITAPTQQHVNNFSWRCGLEEPPFRVPGIRYGRDYSKTKGI